jgi:integration host factor subunit beta
MMVCVQSVSRVAARIPVCRTASSWRLRAGSVARYWALIAPVSTSLGFLILGKYVMATVTKKDLIDRIADREECKRVQVKRIVQNFLDEIINELSKGNRLEFRDFGVFESKIRASRLAQNPKTMDKVKVPSKRTVKFKVGRIMKERLRNTPAAIDPATGLPLEPAANTNHNPLRVER